MKRLIAASLLAGLALAFTSQSTQAACAKPIWDLDYEVYYGEIVPGWNLWYKKPGEGWTLHGTYDTEGEAANRSFFMQEHNVHPEGTQYWIGETTQLKWRLLDTFETYSEATSMVGYLQMLGYQTKIKTVYGGVDYSHLISAEQYNNNAFYRYVMGD